MRMTLDVTWRAVLAAVLVLVLSAVPAAAALKHNPDPMADPECDPDEDEECPPPVGGPNGDPRECQWVGTPANPFALNCDDLCGQDPDGDGWNIGISYGEEDGMSNMDVSQDMSPGCDQPGSGGPEKEIFSFCLSEEGNHIGYAQIDVDQPNLVAKIAHFVEPPGPSGQIEIGINEDLVVVDIGPARGDVDELNKMVCTALGNTVRVSCLKTFFIVYADSLQATPTVMSLDTRGTGVSSTEIALEPHGGPVERTACSEASPFAIEPNPR